MNKNLSNPTIHVCIKFDKRYTPFKQEIIYYAQTYKEAFVWLSKNGGGLYKDILNNVQFEVKENEQWS